MEEVVGDPEGAAVEEVRPPLLVKHRPVGTGGVVGALGPHLIMQAFPLREHLSIVHPPPAAPPPSR